MKLAGIIILVVGLLMTLYTGFNYVTREKVLEIGSLEVTADREHEVNWQPYAGVIVMLAGAGIFYFSQKKPPTT
jgi:uncharacterized membrane protein